MQLVLHVTFDIKDRKYNQIPHSTPPSNQNGKQTHTRINKLSHKAHTVGLLSSSFPSRCSFSTWVSISKYYMHNEEIWRFLNKLKAIITSGLGRFISSKEIFPPSRFYFSNAIVLSYAREYMSHVDVSFWRHVIMTSTVCQQRSECKTLDSVEPLKWRSHEHNNLMRSKCLCCTLTFLVVLSR